MDMLSTRTRSSKISSRADPIRRGIAIAAVALAGLAAAIRTSRLAGASGATAGPFLTLGIVIGAAVLADRIGVFRWLAAAIVPRRASAPAAWAAVLVLAALLSALVNLDVAVVVAMPVALDASARTSTGARWLALAVAAVANAASFLLPTSNLTNLMILTRDPLPGLAYLRDSWLPWILVVGTTIAALTWVLSRDRDGAPERAARGGRLRLAMMLDLVPLFVAATALRALLGAGIPLPGAFPMQTATGAAIAAAANNLPAAAALHAIGASGRWAAILAAAIGPNLLLWGSVATLICRRIARDGGTDLSAGHFTALGSLLVPIQLAIAFAGLHLTGAL